MNRPRIADLSLAAPHTRAQSSGARAERERRRTILVLGVEDALGLRTVERLAAAGQPLTVAGTRNALQRLRARPVKVIDVADPASVRAAIARHEVICNLARLTDTPQGHVGFALTAPRRRRRRALLAAIADGLAVAKPDTRQIQRSSAALYTDGGDDWIAEDSPVQANDSTALAREAERVVSEHIRRSGGAIVLRFAQPYGPGDAWTERSVGLARRGWAPLEGPPEAYFPTVHLDDAAAAVGLALSAPSGHFNVADADPLTNEELNLAFAVAAGHDELHPLRSAFRFPDLELLERSCRLDAQALERATGWTVTAAPSIASWLLQLNDQQDPKGP